MLLLLRSRTSKFLKFAKVCGNNPSNWLPLRLKFLKVFPLANVAGMVPWRIFIHKSNILRTLECTKNFRIMPLKCLWDKSRTSTKLALQIKEGISQLTCYWRQIYCSLRKLRVVKSPWSKLSQKSIKRNESLSNHLGTWP